VDARLNVKVYGLLGYVLELILYIIVHA